MGCNLTERLKVAEAQAGETSRTETPIGTLKPAPLSGSKEPSSPEPRKTDKPKPYPNRTNWLEAQMKKRAVTKNYLSEHGGLARRTVTRTLDGLPVTDDSLDKVAEALSSVGDSVTYLRDPAKLVLETLTALLFLTGMSGPPGFP